MIAGEFFITYVAHIIFLVNVLKHQDLAFDLVNANSYQISDICLCPFFRETFPDPWPRFPIRMLLSFIELT